jgi:hypothetical protein
MCYGLRVNPLRLFLLASVCLLAIPHAGAQAPTANAHDPERPALVAFAHDGFAPGMRVARGDAKEKLLQRFGKPKPTGRVQSTIEGGRAGPTRTMYLYYDGLEIRLGQVVGDSNIWLRKIILTNPGYKLKFGLSIGAKRSQFLAVLGPPNDPSSTKFGSLVYYSEYYGSENGVPAASRSRVDISFDQEDQAQKIVWEYFVWD